MQIYYFILYFAHCANFVRLAFNLPLKDRRRPEMDVPGHVRHPKSRLRTATSPQNKPEPTTLEFIELIGPCVARVVRFGLQAGFGKTPHYRSASPFRSAAWSPLLHAEGGMFFHKSLPVALSKPHDAPGSMLRGRSTLAAHYSRSARLVNLPLSFAFAPSLPASSASFALR